MSKGFINILTLALLTALFSSCSAHRAGQRCANAKADQSLKQAVQWYRNAAEKTALYRQTYAAGTTYVENWVHAHHPKPKSWGVVLDIDETVLDNSWYFDQCQSLTPTEAEFSRYISLEQKSSALAGASAFTHFVHGQGGYVTLISNRDGACCEEGSVMGATINNLEKQNIYFDQVILANHSQSKYPTNKNPRFEATINGKCDPQNMVCSTTLPAHEVIAYFGDNIQDFPHFFQKEVHNLPSDDKTFDRFPKGYFILPNPMYGSWQKNKE